jgi:S-adenosylmethionine:tRNA ribosyltransferase-isomerase
VRLDRFDYELPDDAIAQTPVEPRDAARLLVDNGPDAPPDDRQVGALADVLRPGDVLVRNTTRVLPARLALRKESGGAVEVLLLARHGGSWEALVRPSRRVPPGARLRLATAPDSGPGADLEVEVGGEVGDGCREVRLLGVDDELVVLGTVGEVPLPPYIHEPLPDPERYQTVYAQRPASVAAPTAGLHLTDRILQGCRDRGVAVADVELDVGLGTFRPITAPVVEDHVMHAERYRVPATTWAACRAAIDDGGRIVAVGTTTLRALESVAATGELEGCTTLFLHPGHRPSMVDVLLTNFHQPRSSLLVLLEAFVGPRWRELYDHARRSGYRFLSFGDAMLVARAEAAGSR